MMSLHMFLLKKSEEVFNYDVRDQRFKKLFTAV